MVKNLFKRIIIIAIILAVVGVVSYIMLRYDAEGEKSMPFSLGKILIISTVDGHVNEDQQNIWNIGVEQVNDVYIYIEKNIDKDLTIKQIKLENFQLNKDVSRGVVKLLRPTGDLPNLYTYSQEDYFSKDLTYIGSSIDDMKSLEVSNEGGVLGFRLSLTDLGNFISNDAEQITYDGSLLSGLGINNEEIKFNVSFDIIITTSENVNFKGTINLDLPIGNIIENGTENKEISDFENIVFKRI